MTKTTATPSQESNVRTLGTHAREFVQRHWPVIVLAALLVLVLAVAGYRTWSHLPASTTPATTAACTCASIASRSGISVAADAPTQSASVDTSRSMPSRA